MYKELANFNDETSRCIVCHCELLSPAIMRQHRPCRCPREYCHTILGLRSIEKHNRRRMSLCDGMNCSAHFRTYELLQTHRSQEHGQNIPPQFD